MELCVVYVWFTNSDTGSCGIRIEETFIQMGLTTGYSCYCISGLIDGDRDCYFISLPSIYRLEK